MVDGGILLNSIEEHSDVERKKINILWEVTQALIAISITAAKVYAIVYPTNAVAADIDPAFFLIVGFYFGRTNHNRPTNPTVGR